MLGSTATFSWVGDSAVDNYWLGIGTTAASLDGDPYGDLFHETVGSASGGSRTVSGSPLGTTIFVRLWSRRAGSWYSKDYQFQTADTPPPIQVLLKEHGTSSDPIWCHIGTPSIHRSPA